jgi:hypothetical protein
MAARPAFPNAGVACPEVRGATIKQVNPLSGGSTDESQPNPGQSGRARSIRVARRHCGMLRARCDAVGRCPGAGRCGWRRARTIAGNAGKAGRPDCAYPDDLVAIILPASTFPLEIVQADRF